MLWRTHIRMANEILYRRGVSKSSFEVTHFREGVIAPDKWRDFPHHHGKERSIEKHIMKARGFFLNNELAKTYFHLGVALHYIQDSYTSLSTRSKHHTRWEEQIDQAYFTDDLQQLVERTFYNRPDRREEYLERAKLLSGKIEGKETTLRLATLPSPGLSYWGYRKWGKPYVDANFALRVSYLISKSVFAPKRCPKLQEELNHVRREYETRLKEAEISIANSVVESIRKRNELEKRKRKNGFLQKMKNGFLTVTSKKYGFDAKRKFEQYRKKKHLTAVLKEYKRASENAIASHRDWYHYDVPKINLNAVEKDLLSVQEASKHLGVEESYIRELIANDAISGYYIENEELVRRSELTKQLSE